MKIKYIIISLLVSIISVSCEDMLDTKTTFEIEESDVWRIPNLAKGILHNAYNGISSSPSCYSSQYLDSATDNATTRSYDSDIYKLAMGSMSSFNNPIGNWDTCYSMIEYINLFLENGLTDNTLYNLADLESDEAIKERLKGEALFLRAWWHFELLKVYGGKSSSGEALGIPYLTKYISQEEASNYESFTRQTYSQTCASIIADLDAAALLLPLEYSGSDQEFGVQQINRANKRACYVLKSRVLIYSASPAYQDDSIVTTTGMGSYDIVDPTTYKRKWEEVALAINELITNEGMESFSSIVSDNLADLSLGISSDFVFYKYFNSKAQETNNFPPYYYGNGITSPSLNLVKSCCLKEGGEPLADVLKNNPGNDISLFYDSLDSRFSLNVYHHGALFADTSVALDMIWGGKDSRSFSSKATRTGFYLAKFIAKKSTMLDPINGYSAKHANPLLRKFELYINYAEAANEAWGAKGKGDGCKKSSYDIITEIRSNAGIINDVYLENMSNDEDNFRTLIHNERRLEFAFENHRYFDLRRWLEPLDSVISGVNISTNDNGIITTEEVALESRKYEVKHYYAPLPYNELAKSEFLINNVGW